MDEALLRTLTPSAVALTLRAMGGLTSRQIAQAYLVPEATMGQRISRARRTVSSVRFSQPGDVTRQAARLNAPLGNRAALPV